MYASQGSGGGVGGTNGSAALSPTTSHQSFGDIFRKSTSAATTIAQVVMSSSANDTMNDEYDETLPILLPGDIKVQIELFFD